MSFTFKAVSAVSVRLWQADFDCDSTVGVAVIRGYEHRETSATAIRAYSPDVGETTVDVPALLKEQEGAVHGESLATAEAPAKESNRIIRVVPQDLEDFGGNFTGRQEQSVLVIVEVCGDSAYQLL